MNLNFNFNFSFISDLDGLFCVCFTNHDLPLYTLYYFFENYHASCSLVRASPSRIHISNDQFIEIYILINIHIFMHLPSSHHCEASITWVHKTISPHICLHGIRRTSRFTAKNTTLKMLYIIIVIHYDINYFPIRKCDKHAQCQNRE